MKTYDRNQKMLIHAIVDPHIKALGEIVKKMKPMRKKIRAAIRAARRKR